MRKLVLLSALVPCLVLLAGCPKKKGEDVDAAADADAAQTAEPAAEDAAPAPAAEEPSAKNAAEVARFAAETKIADDGAKPAVLAAVRTSPKGGSVVANLKPGYDVTKLAEYQDCFLITFADPKEASTTLMGWLEKSSFTYVAPKDKDAGAKSDAGAKIADAGAAPAADAGPPKCAAGEERVTLSATTNACKKKCKDDKGCKKGPCSVASTTSGKAVRVCAAD